MIHGIGMDLIDIARVRRLLQSSTGERFRKRILTPAEQDLAQSRQSRLAEYVAGRFAAKEAVVKAIGCGIGKEVGFQDIEVLPTSSGKPGCSLSDSARNRLGWEPSTRIHLSITHCENTAGAYAVIEVI